jgi:hypothetical protein
MSRPPHDLPDDLAKLGALLREERPELSPIALDGVRQRALRGAVASRRRSRRPSLAVALCLCFGIVLSSAGTGMAISGLSSTSDTAVEAQYPESPGVTGQGEAPTTPTLIQLADTGGGGDSTPAAEIAGASGGSEPAQATQQLSAAEGNATLPFTGYAAIPVAGMGIALLLGGLVLRRRQTGSDGPTA